MTLDNLILLQALKEREKGGFVVTVRMKQRRKEKIPAANDNVKCFQVRDLVWRVYANDSGNGLFLSPAGNVLEVDADLVADDPRTRPSVD